jgi:hypothetical protein
MMNQPELPYAGTSGWSGTDTSRDRAVEADRSGKTLARQRRVYSILATFRGDGLTWRELSDETGWHHGQASGVLSVLHKAGKIERLEKKRDKCHVYVLPEYSDGQILSPYRNKMTQKEMRDTLMSIANERDSRTRFGLTTKALDTYFPDWREE